MLILLREWDIFDAVSLSPGYSFLCNLQVSDMSVVEENLRTLQQTNPNFVSTRPRIWRGEFWRRIVSSSFLGIVGVCICELYQRMQNKGRILDFETLITILVGSVRELNLSHVNQHCWKCLCAKSFTRFHNVLPFSFKYWLHAVMWC